MSEARRHHYISQFYLRQFAAPGDVRRLYVTDLQANKTFTASTRDVAHERDFHRIDVPGEDRNAVESALATLEGEVSTALDTIIERGKVGDDESAQLLLFYMALLLVKNPAMRSTIDDFTDKVMSTFSKHEAADEARFEAKIQERIADGTLPADTDAKELRRALLSDDFQVSLAREGHLDMEFSNARALLPYFIRRKWAFLHAREGRFVTSDRPVVLMWDDPRTNAPIGLAHRDARILFPLSSETAILGGFGIPDGSAQVPRMDVAGTNGQIILHSARQVYARDDTFEYLFFEGKLKPASELLTDEALVRGGSSS